MVRDESSVVADGKVEAGGSRVWHCDVNGLGWTAGVGGERVRPNWRAIPAHVGVDEGSDAV